MQFQTKIHPVDHVKNIQWISTLKKELCFSLKTRMGSLSKKRDVCKWKLKFFENKDLSFKKGEFFYSVLKVYMSLRMLHNPNGE